MRNGSTLDRVRCGFLPLMDAAIPIVAREQGFAGDEGIDLELFRETSWANVRDRMAVGQFDIAHMLAPMPIAAALGLTAMELRVIAPMTLGTGGNVVTVSAAAWSQLETELIDGTAAPAGRALATLVESRKAAGERRLTFAVVHPFSCHTYELRYWLAASGIEPDRDVAITVLPPPYMPDALASGQIDGCCVGEPWSTVAVDCGAGRMLTTKSAIWRSSLEKVLGVREAWAEENPELLLRLIRVFHRAAMWCDQATNIAQLADLLGAPSYLSLPSCVIVPGLTGVLSIGDGSARVVRDFHRFARNGATFPRLGQALWIYSQMARWQQTSLSSAGQKACERVFRPDLYRAALGPLAVTDAEGGDGLNSAVVTGVARNGNVATAAPDGFFDERAFDPRDIETYLRTLPFGRTHTRL